MLRKERNLLYTRTGTEFAKRSITNLLKNIRGRKAENTEVRLLWIKIKDPETATIQADHLRSNPTPEHRFPNVNCKAVKMFRAIRAERTVQEPLNAIRMLFLPNQ